MGSRSVKILNGQAGAEEGMGGLCPMFLSWESSLNILSCPWYQVSECLTALKNQNKSVRQDNKLPIHRTLVPAPESMCMVEELGKWQSKVVRMFLSVRRGCDNI